MKNYFKYLTFFVIFFSISSYCLAQSAESSASEKNNDDSEEISNSNNKSPKYFVASNILVNGGGFYLDKNSLIGFGINRASLSINENNIDKANSTGFGVVYGYAFDSFENNSFFVGSLLGYGEVIFETDDGSKYTYSGLGLNIIGGYNWNFGNNLAFSLGIGPSISGLSKQSESLKSSKNYGKNVEDRIKEDRFRLIGRVPFFILYYSF